MSNATAADGGVRLMFAFKVKINEKIHAEIVEQLEAKLADGGVRLMFAFKVKINEKIHAEIVEQLEAKLAAGEIPDEEVKTVETVEASTRRPRF